MTAIPGVIYTLDRTARKYRAKGRPDVDASGRNDLVYGSYLPGAAETGPTTPLTSIYVNQAGGASTTGYVTGDKNTYGGIWVISASNYPLTDVLLPTGQVRRMAVLDGLDVHGMIDARVPVLLKGSKTRGRGGNKVKVAGQWWCGLSVVNPGAAGSIVVDSEMTVDEPTELDMAGVNGGAGVTLERANIHGGIDGYRFGDINSGCNANDVIGTWVHDLLFITGSFAPQPEGPHCDAGQYSPNIRYNGKQRIIGSYLNARIAGHPTDDNLNKGPSCIMVPGATSSPFNLEVIDSWLEWGWFPLNSGGTPAAGSSILLDGVKARPGWHLKNGVPYHEVSTSAWNAVTTRIDCTNWDDGGAWRRTA